MIRVLSVASECFPLVKTGGLADVVGALPGALLPEGVRMRVLLPGYPGVLAQLDDAETVFERMMFGYPARVLSGIAGGLPIFAIDAPHLYARAGNPYSASDDREWPDNAQRFAGLSMVAADFGLGRVPAFEPDVVHVHDWQAGLTPALLHYWSDHRPPSVLTIHNLAFQGQFPAELLASFGLPPESYGIDGVEYYGAIGMLKAGVRFADHVTTVSPTYAAEIQTPDGSMGMGGLLARRGAAGELTGILNGIDTRVWDPATDPLLPTNFDHRHPTLRVANKTVLRERLHLNQDANALLFGVVSRLTEQKGMDLLPAVIDAILAGGGQLAVVGSGDREIQAAFARIAASHPGRVAAVFGYSEELAHLIQGAADALLVPSRFEPCGLSQLCALRYGAVPVVSRVGGLADTVIDANLAACAAGVATGIQFAPPNEGGLRDAIARTFRLWGNKPVWRQTQLNGLRSDVSWAQPAQAYAALYRRLSTQ